MNRVLLRKMRRDLLERKGALLALLAIVAVGVGCYVAMAACFRDLDGARERYYREQRLADFSVDLKRAPTWSLDAVAAQPNVAAVRGRIAFAARVDLPQVDLPIAGLALSMPERPAPVLNGILLRSGTWFSDRDAEEAIVDEAFAQAHGLKPGDRIPVLLLDKRHEVLVVGTAMSPEFVYVMPPSGGLAPDPARYAVLYMPREFLERSCDLQGAYNQLVGKVHDRSDTALDNTLRRVEEELDAYGVTRSTPFGELPSVRFLADELAGLKVSATVIPVIFLGVAALVLNVLMRRLVTQQRTVVGTLKAVGYGSAAITLHYAAYGVVVGLLGGAAGLGLGWWLQATMLGIYRRIFALPAIALHVYPDLLLTGVGVSVAFAVLGTLRGVRMAAGLAPAEAMRPPPPEKAGRILPERVPALWRPLPFRCKMVLRAVFRNPFRSSVTALATVVATALIVSTLSLFDAVDYLIQYEFARTARQDVTVSLRDPRGHRALAEVGAMPSVAGAEPQLAVVCDLAHGPRRERVGVTGLGPDRRLYTPLDSAGRPIEPLAQGLVLSRKLADILGVRQGDVLRLRPLIGERRETEAPVAGLVEGYLGLSAYADIAYLSGLVGEPWAANVLLGKHVAGAPREGFLAELRQRPQVVGLGERRRSLTRIDETFGETMTSQLAIIILFAGLIAFGSVLNAALVSLNERRREVGTLRVLGYTPGQISLIFSGESFLLNAVGVAAGAFAGIGLTHLLAAAYDTELYRFPVVVYPSRLVLGAALVGAFAALAQLIVYRLIRRLPWLDVLKLKE
ncbi:MAG: ABC transporter permease [Candidatus Brocadiia bacterium]